MTASEPKKLKVKMKLPLRSRIMALALVTLFVGLGLFSWLGLRSVNQSIQTTLTERLTLARTLASQLDQMLTYVLVRFQDAARTMDNFPTPEQFNSFAESTGLMFTRSGIYVRDFVFINEDGKVIRTDPDNAKFVGTDMSAFPEVQEVLSTGLPRISGLVSSPFTAAPTVLIFIPYINAEAKVVGVVACSIDIKQLGVFSFNQEIRIGQTGYVEIVDHNGIVLVRTSPGTSPSSFESSDHPVRFAQLITQGQATVGTCHRCHENGTEVKRLRDVLAFAPLSTTSWGVAIRQSEEEALSPAKQMGRGFLIVGIGLLASTVFLIWAMIQGIVKPIRMLTLAAKKVAADDFGASVPLHRGDEIGELSAAFDKMRQEISKSRDEMMQHYKEAKNKEELRGQLLNSVISAQEEERKRIARELHDDYGQTITALIMTVESLEDMTNPQQAGFKEKLNKTKSVLVHALDDMRRLTIDLRPPSLDDLGLAAAIQAHIQTYASQAGIQIQFKHKGISEHMNPVVEIAIFRIIQEAVHNAVKHAKASIIDVNLVANGNTIMASIEDNGQGFDVQNIFNTRVGTRSFGLLGIQERTSLLNGSFTVNSTIGKGTRIQVVIPTGISNLPATLADDKSTRKDNNNDKGEGKYAHTDNG